MKFKNGNKVKVTGTSTKCGGTCTVCKFLGKTGTVMGYGGDGLIIVKNFNSGPLFCSGFEEKHLELVDVVKKIIKPYGIVAFLNGGVK
jgi:hypothetical protein